MYSTRLCDIQLYNMRTDITLMHKKISVMWLNLPHGWGKLSQSMGEVDPQQHIHVFMLSEVKSNVKILH